MNTPKYVKVLGVLTLLGVGSFGGYFVGENEILYRLGLDREAFYNGHADCEAKTGQRCRAYGGFAPESLFKRESLPKGEAL